MTGLIPFVMVAFGLGLFHAPNMDHVVAVSGLSGSRSKPKRIWVLCSHWAIDHSLTLLTVGTGVLILGLAVPHHLSQLAEKIVGFLLVGIGFWALWNLWKKNCQG